MVAREGTAEPIDSALPTKVVHALLDWRENRHPAFPPGSHRGPEEVKFIRMLNPMLCRLGQPLCWAACNTAG